MKVLDQIKAINKKLEPFYLLIIMIGFFITGFISLSKFLFSPPELIVKVEKDNINYPSTVNDKYVDIYSFIQDSVRNDTLKSYSVAVYQYLIKTKHQWILEVQNNSNKTIRAINVRLSNVKSMTSCAVSSSYLLEEEKQRLLNNLTFQKQSGIIYLKDGVNLPPKGDFKIFLWGEFNEFSWIESLIVDYDGGSAKIEYPQSFTGLKAFIAEYFFEIFIFVLLTFSIVYILQLKSHVSTEKNTSDSN